MSHDADEEEFWTPGFLLSPGGIWVNPSVPGALVQSAQPTVGAWSLGTGWSTVGGLYTHAAGGVASITQTILIMGCRYKISWAITAITAGTITPSVGAAADTAQSAVGSYATELTCTTNTTLGFAASSSCDATIRIDAVENISLSQVNPVSATGSMFGSVFLQGTATAQPWKSQTLIHGQQVIQYDGSADCLSSSLPNTSWDWLHQSADGFTVYLMVKSADVTTAYGMLFNTTFAGGEGSGVALYTGSGVAVMAAYQNGVLRQYAYDVLTANATILAIRCMPSVISMRFNGVEAAHSALYNYISAGHCLHTLEIGQYSGGYFFNGVYGDLVICAGYHTITQVKQTERRLATKWGVTLP